MPIFLTMFMAFAAPYAAGGLPPFAVGMQGVGVQGGVAAPSKAKRKRSSGEDSARYKRQILDFIRQGFNTQVKINDKISFTDLPRGEENKAKRKKRINRLLGHLATEGSITEDGKDRNATRWAIAINRLPGAIKPTTLWPRQCPLRNSLTIALP